MPTTFALTKLARQLHGTLHHDEHLRRLYATDASVYRELPLAVAYPKDTHDLQHLLQFAREQNSSLIPRTAGTSLAGQCVGDGIVVDLSRHFTGILELNVAERWVRVQPGVVRDELNAYLQPHGLFFSPITSTANRAMIGGMVGNNSCGTNSIVYGTTRDKVLELHTFLSDGSPAIFNDLSVSAFAEKTTLPGLEGAIYRQLQQELTQKDVQEEIRQQFPKTNIHRRNTGYALDVLLAMQPFTPDGPPFNLAKLLAGSEGTLALTSEIKLKLDPLPPPHELVLAAHFHSINESMLATRLAMQHQPAACELMDKIILDCTKDNIAQRKNRQFIEGDPAAVLLIEFRGNTPEEALIKAQALQQAFQAAGMGYAFPLVHPPQTKGVWALRSAGLGLLANIPGDKKAVACIEDTAVALDDLPDYIADFARVMKRFDQQSVYYAHAGAGEIHLRPILDLKTAEGVQDFYDISLASAQLVKQYRGSLSGEHGDGRVRAPFIPLMVGEKNYALFRRLKQCWDPGRILNPGKIVDAPPMNTSLRYQPGQATPEFTTLMDFSSAGGLLRMAEKCNGSGDCRKLPLSGGVMCPSYQATRREQDTTRARANTLREYLGPNQQPNPFDQEAIKEVMDLCLSCKGCTSECPSNVDVASMKAEFLYQYYKSHPIPLRARAFAHINQLNKLGSLLPGLYNAFLKNSLTGKTIKRILGIAQQRDLPLLQKQHLRKWYKQQNPRPKGTPIKTVYLFCDEFTNYNDTPIGIKAIELLTRLGYQLEVKQHPESGRAAISKGLLEVAKTYAEKNVRIFSPIVTADTPLLGIEPSALLSFRDEYPRLVDTSLVDKAKQLAQHTYTIEAFLYHEFQAGNIRPEQFTSAPRRILLHGHCHQKALSDVSFSAHALSIPRYYQVETIPSGCCGMAGSFGYEKEHYALSMQIGALVLFPAIEQAKKEVQIAAPGSSCRHQIADGTGRTALHPIEILWEALL